MSEKQIPEQQWPPVSVLLFGGEAKARDYANQNIAPDLLVNFDRILATELVSQKEDRIRAAIAMRISNSIERNGMDDQIRRHGRLDCHPDGTETFCWDGEPIVTFGPLQMTTRTEGDKVLIEITTDVRLHERK